MKINNNIKELQKEFILKMIDTINEKTNFVLMIETPTTTIKDFKVYRFGVHQVDKYQEVFYISSFDNERYYFNYKYCSGFELSDLIGFEIITKNEINFYFSNGVIIIDE